MDALRSLSGGQPNPPSRSFSDVLTGKSSTPFNPKPPAQFHGKPAVHFSEEDNRRYSEPFNYTLIGKFSYGRPSMETLRKSFQTIGFSSPFTLGLIDYRHILIRFHHQEDYLRCWKRGVWTIEGFLMRVIKWHPHFSVESESPIVPVWINLPLLPVHLYNKEALFSIARLIGDPLQIDAATESLSRPSQARVCIELDLMKERCEEVYISVGSHSFWQKIVYENAPLYCACCLKIGHQKDSCSKKDGRKAPHTVQLDANKSRDTAPKATTRKEYKPVQKNIEDYSRSTETSVPIIQAAAKSDTSANKSDEIPKIPEAVAAEKGTETALAHPDFVQRADEAAEALNPCNPTPVFVQGDDPAVCPAEASAVFLGKNESEAAAESRNAEKVSSAESPKRSDGKKQDAAIGTSAATEAAHSPTQSPRAGQMLDATAAQFHPVIFSINDASAAADVEADLSLDPSGTAILYEKQSAANEVAAPVLDQPFVEISPCQSVAKKRLLLTQN